MHHTLAWTKAIGQTVNDDIPPLADQIVQISSSNHYILPRNLQVLGAWAGSATLNRIRWNSPKVRQITPSYWRPVERSPTPLNIPNWVDYYKNPFILNGLEEVVVEATSGLAMGTERLTAVAILCDQKEPMPVGDVYFLRFTGTTAVLANVWQVEPIVFEQQLPVGTYDIVGGEVQSANGIAFRFTVDDQYWRPGGLMITALGNRSTYGQHFGNWGRWGSFRTTSMPRLEVLCNGADAAFEGYLEVVRRSIG